MEVMIACVHATSRAMAAAAQMLAERPGLEHKDILEPTLLEYAELGQRGREVFRKALVEAAVLEPDLILTTCSMYTQYLPALRQEFSRPVLGIDEPMIEVAAQRGGRLALVGSIRNAIEFTGRLVRDRAEALGRSVRIDHALLVPRNAGEEGPEADDAAARITRLAADVDTVLIVQLSLSSLRARLQRQDVRERTFTSAETVMQRLDEMLGQQRG